MNHQLSVDPGVLKSVSAGIEDDVVAILEKAMRAMPYTKLPPDALGDIGSEAISRFYTPLNDRECEEFRRGWHSARDIAEAVRNCGNTYVSTDTQIADYLNYRSEEQEFAQSWAVDGDKPAQTHQEGEQEGFRLWIDETTRDNREEMAIDLSAIQLATAALKGRHVCDTLTAYGRTLEEIARQRHLSQPERFSDIGHLEWRKAVFTTSVSSALDARRYVRKATHKVGEHALPGISGALSGAWSGEARDTALSTMNKFTQAVNAARDRADGIISAFDKIFSAYQSEADHVLERVDRASAAVSGQAQITEDFLVTVCTGLKREVGETVRRIKAVIDSNLQASSRVDIVRFPTARHLPDAHTWSSW